MTDTTEQHLWPIPNGQYRYLANWLVEQNPDAAAALVEATNEHTNYAQAANRIAAEGVLGISFGLIARLRIDAPSLDIARAIGGGWAARAHGADFDPEVWSSLWERAHERLAAAEQAGQDWPATVALRGLTLAAKPDDPTAVRDILERATLAWNREIENQHQAVMFWATDIVITHTRASRKANDDE